MSQVPLFILSRLLSSLWVSRTGSASDWCALQEALYKCIDTIQYNNDAVPLFLWHLSQSPHLVSESCQLFQYLLASIFYHLWTYLVISGRRSVLQIFDHTLYLLFAHIALVYFQLLNIL